MRIGSVHLSVSIVLAVIVASLIGWFSRPEPRSVLETASGANSFHVYHEHLLGTSLELWMNAPDAATAQAAENAVLAEIERLRRIFSLYDAESELSRLNRTRRAMAVSPEMIEVLQLYDVWQGRSDGVLSGRVGALVDVWKNAEKLQREPDDAMLSRIVAAMREPGWSVDVEHSTVTRLTDQPLNLNAIAKGYIIQKAAAAARKAAPKMEGLLLNLGGDIAAWGRDSNDRSGWLVGVQNPLEPYDNAKPLARLQLAHKAVATSGGYERFYTIADKRFSHLFDPRSGRPATPVASATVIAADNATANALATTLCIVPPVEGLKLVAATAGAECLIVTPDGEQHRSVGFAALELPEPIVAIHQDEEKKPVDKKAMPWPADYEVRLTVTLPEVASKRYRRPYVAVWVEDADAKPVRTITEWGNNSRWIKDLPQWWKFAKNDAALVKAVSRATRPPGKHSLVWDGKDDKGNPLPQGTYTIHVEVHREHGKLVRQSGRIVCAAEPANITLEKNAETGDTLVEFAKKKAP